MTENTRIAQLQDFLKDTPNDAFLNYALAIEYVGMEKDELAQPIFEQLLELQPEYTATYYHLGKLYERADRKDDAENIYKKGIAITMKKREQHALSELQNALTNLWIDDDE
ncbi:MAG: tetratricopeptide repeat protein [bacterium]